MKSKNITLIFASILAVFLLAGFASASTVFTLENTSEIPSEISHGDSINVELNVTYDGETDGQINLTWTGVNPSNSDFWTLPSLNQIVNDTAGPVSELTDFTFSIPKHYSSGQIDASLKMESDSGVSGTTDYFNFSVNVPEHKSLNLSGEDFDEDSNKTTITLTNNGNVDLNNINLTSNEKDFNVNLSSAEKSDLNDFDLTPEEEISVTVTMTSDVDDLHLGENIITVIASSPDLEKDTTKELSYNKKYAWDTPNIDGALTIDDLELILEKGFGDEDEQPPLFFPLDTITAEFTLENKGNWDTDEDVDVDDIEIEVWLYDTAENEDVMNEDDMEISKNDFDLKDNGDIDLTITFKVNPEDLNIGSSEYNFHVKATGETDSRDDSYDGNETAVSESLELTIEQDEFIAIDDLRVSSPLDQESYNCGSELEIKGDIWNIGESDIDQENVFVRVYNKKLGINEIINITEDLDALESLPLDLTLEIPEGLDERIYGLEFIVYDDEDLDDNDIYEINNDDYDEAIYTLLLDVKGQCTIPQAEFSETFLSSGEYAGDTFTVETKISNTGDGAMNYTLTASDYTDWASSISFSEQTFELAPGETKDIQLDIKTREDISGNNTFNMEVYSGNELATKQPVEVPVKEKQKFMGINWDEVNFVTILSIAIAVVLIAIIIVLLVRISQKGKASE